ncbi:palmitoyltransferase ZDHHC20-B-like isoform X3 [Amphiura filiformis]|uniref:palmitoyltransferase ZDHHC20-B-like isoform X3 n=1 Tax=Amphiura filiformis TaxID=82378 RepID=UPI003B210402
MGVLSVCMKIAGWFPVVFITAVVLWSYYAYVFELCIFTLAPLHSIVQLIFYILFYHCFLVMFVWSYWKTIFTQIGRMPTEFYLTSSELQRYEAEDRNEQQLDVLKQISREKRLPVHTRTFGGGMRYCGPCKAIKPDRAHHCSVCSTCVLKMDHHCPWVNNCVGFSNYKYFVLFLLYALLYCLYVAVTVLPYFIQFWTGGLGGENSKFHILFLFFAAAMFAISVSVLFCMHIHLTLTNRSTLESFRPPVFRHGPDKDGFSRGSACNNFREIFGEEPKYWLLPMPTGKGDGVSYPVQARDEDSDRLIDPGAESDVLSGPEDEEDRHTKGKGEIRNSMKSTVNYATMGQPEVPSVAINMENSTDGQVNYGAETNSINSHR